MALFANFRYSPNRRRHILRRPRRRFPDLTRLDRLCPKTATHPLPVKMVCIAKSKSDRGHPMAVIACPFRGCTWREGWVHDYRTGCPTRLWAGYHNGRN